MSPLPIHFVVVVVADCSGCGRNVGDIGDICGDGGGEKDTVRSRGRIALVCLFFTTKKLRAGAGNTTHKSVRKRERHTKQAQKQTHQTQYFFVFIFVVVSVVRICHRQLSFVAVAVAVEFDVYIEVKYVVYVVNVVLMGMLMLLSLLMLILLCRFFWAMGNSFHSSKLI